MSRERVHAIVKSGGLVRIENPNCRKGKLAVPIISVASLRTYINPLRVVRRELKKSQAINLARQQRLEDFKVEQDK